MNQRNYPVVPEQSGDEDRKLNPYAPCIRIPLGPHLLRGRAAAARGKRFATVTH